MKKLLILLFIAGSAKAQTTTPDSAKYFEGCLRTVCGVVTGVKTTTTGNTYLHFGAKFPNHSFAAVIFRKDSVDLPDQPEYYLNKISV